jgi:hypothetical protein
MKEREESFRQMKKSYDEFMKLCHDVETKRRKIIDEQFKRLENIGKIKPDSWQKPAPDDLVKLLEWKERFKVKFKRWKFLSWLPYFSKWAYSKPLYYMFLFFPNNRLGIIAKEQDWDGTLSLNTQTKQLNPNKVWQFGTNSCMFFNYNNAEPLDVTQKGLKTCTINPQVYKDNLENKQMTQLIHATEIGIQNKHLFYVLIGVGVLLLLLIANSAGWIDLSHLVQK